MSSGEVRRHRGGFGRLLRSELRLVYGRWRNRILLLVLAAAPVLVGVAVRFSNGPHDGEGPQFLAQVSGNGLFLVFTSLVVTLPFFLPLAVSVVAGDLLAGEAAQGTLRYLLVVPVGRTRLLAAKWLAAVVFATSAVLAVAVTALVVGAALFPLGDVTLLSGTTVPLGVGLLRALAVAGYVAVSLLGLVTLGLLVSALTEVPVAAMALTLGAVIVFAVLDSVPQVGAIHPYLLTHYWLDFGELLRAAPRYGRLLTGVGVQAAYAAVAGALVWARFRDADVTA